MVFVTYSHDSQELKDQVYGLSEKLRSQGVKCEIDQYTESPKEGWALWSQRMIEQAESVLVVCTKAYSDRFLGKAKEGIGLGAKWEGSVIRQILYECGMINSKYIPIIFHTSDKQNIPINLRDVTNYDLSTEEGYIALHRRLTRQPEITPGKVGQVPKRPPRKPLPDFELAHQDFNQGQNEFSEPKSRGPLKMMDNVMDRIPKAVLVLVCAGFGLYAVYLLIMEGPESGGLKIVLGVFLTCIFVLRSWSQGDIAMEKAKDLPAEVQVKVAKDAANLLPTDFLSIISKWSK